MQQNQHLILTYNIQIFIFLAVCKRSWQVMPLLWPRPLNSSQGRLHTSQPIEGRHSSTGVTVLPSAHLLRLRRQQDNRIHQRASWWNWSLQWIETSEAIGTTATAAEWGGIESALTCDLSIFRRELDMGSICYRQLIFHWWPSKDERAEVEERGRGRWDDNMALRGSQGSI